MRSGQRKLEKTLGQVQSKAVRLAELTMENERAEQRTLG